MPIKFVSAKDIAKHSRIRGWQVIKRFLESPLVLATKSGYVYFIRYVNRVVFADCLSVCVCVGGNKIKCRAP